jgi:hypothetical protein
MGMRRPDPMSGMGGKRTLPSHRRMGKHPQMATDTLKVEVLKLVVEQTGVVPEKVQLSSRLLHDIGMDGDDAVDFFNRVHERFGTDLTHLHEHWSEHFGPEGISCWYGLVIIPAAVVGGVVAGVAGLSTFWGVAMALALLVALLWAVRRWGPPDRTVPVTVGEVVAAVEAGAWPSRPQA